jgi:hypothetical protein
MPTRVIGEYFFFGHHPAHAVLVHGEEECFFALDARVESSRGDFSLLADSGNGEGFVPSLFEEPDAAVQDPLPRFPTASLERWPNADGGHLRCVGIRRGHGDILSDRCVGPR